MAQIAKVRRNAYQHLTQIALLVFCKKVVQLTLNGDEYKDIQPQVTALNVAAKHFEAMKTIADATNSRIDNTNRHNAAVALMKTMDMLANYIDIFAADRTEYVEGTGNKCVNTGTPSKPNQAIPDAPFDVTLTRTIYDGKCLISLELVDFTMIGYVELQWFNKEKNLWMGGNSIQSIRDAIVAGEMMNLPSMSTVRIRAIAVSKANKQSPPSEESTVKVF